MSRTHETIQARIPHLLPFRSPQSRLFPNPTTNGWYVLEDKVVRSTCVLCPLIPLLSVWDKIGADEGKTGTVK
jgi:hypothetical protein